MPPKRATFITFGTDEQCNDTRRFIENAGVDLDIRDLDKRPLSEDEVNRLISHFPPEYFLNPGSRSFVKHGLDKGLPDRDELVKLIAQDHTLLRRPIIKTNRLFTVGCDRRRISEMLQISANGRPGDDDRGNNGSGHREAAGTSK